MSVISSMRDDGIDDSGSSWALGPTIVVCLGFCFGDHRLGLVDDSGERL